MKRKSLTEKELIDNSNDKRIKDVYITQGHDGYFKLNVILDWTDAVYFIRSQRGNERRWSSLDRLLNYLKRNNVLPKTIKLTFK